MVNELKNDKVKCHLGSNRSGWLNAVGKCLDHIKKNIHFKLFSRIFIFYMKKKCWFK